MKAFKLYCLLAIIILLASCSADNNGDNNFANATPQIQCITNDIVGPTAVYWDYAHGIPAPFTRVPLIQNPQGRFNHRAVFTNLNLSIPQGYTATEILEQNVAYGVDFRRSNNDLQNKVLLRYYPLVTFQGNLTTDQIRKIIIDDLMINEYQFNGAPTVNCTSPTQILNLGGGLTRSFSARLITFQNIRAVIWLASTPTPFGNSVTVSVSAGPINEFDNLVMEVFFPLSFELLIRDRESLSDRDRDGTPDIDDREPDSPNVQ